ncbi:hypothetical protein ABEF95_014599 [Exophiala dermatitidis]
MKPATSSLQCFRHLSSAPRAHLFSSTSRASRFISSTSCFRSDNSSSSPFSSFGGPAPPRLPEEEQKIFESLQRASTGAFSTPRSTPTPRINQSPDLSEVEAAEAQSTVDIRVQKIRTANNDDVSDDKKKMKEMLDRAIEARGRGEELHPNVVRGAEPEFEGDVNPKTGEVGGPKNEPLRWGAAGEWTYNGRTTDF